MSSTTGNGLPPAGWYSDPHSAGQQRWWNGTGWAENVRTQPVPVRTQQGARRASAACPTCGSGDARTLSVIRDQGTTTGTGVSSGWVQGSGSQPGHMATFTTRMTSYTETARAAAPPSKRFNGVALLAASLPMGIILGWGGYELGSSGAVGTPLLNVSVAAVVGILLFAVGIFLTPLDSAYNRDVYPGAYAQWSRSWQCQRCGTVFIV